jgi:CubicO group peptidase (beta-lactamase class C family)
MDLYSQLDSVLDEIVNTWDIPGLSVGIVQADRTVYIRCFGVRNIVTGMPVDRDTIFCIASASKCFTAAAVMQLAEYGKLDLDAPVQRYLPDFSMEDDRCRQITVRHLLCHMSGLPDMDEDEYDVFLAAPEDDLDALKRYVAGLRKKKLAAAPGESFSYSNIGYNVLGCVIANVSGVSFEDYMREHILLPSGMHGSTFYFPKCGMDRLAVPHIRTPALAVRPCYPYHRADAPASFLHTTLPDMLSWCGACADMGRTKGQRIMSETGYRKMWTPIVEWGFPPLYECMGLGWTLGHYKGAETVSHGGMGMGWADFLTILPDQESAAVLMCNAETPARSRIIRSLLDVTLGLVPVPGTVSWVVPLTRAYQNGGIRAVYDACRAIRSDSRYVLDPDDLINLAHQLHSAGNDQALTEMLAFSLSVFPDHAATRAILHRYQGFGQG